MTCKHPDVVALFKTGPIVEVDSKYLGEFTVEDYGVREYVCTKCGMRNPFVFGEKYYAHERAKNNVMTGYTGHTGHTGYTGHTGLYNVAFGYQTINRDKSPTAHTTTNNMNKEEFHKNLNRVKIEVNKKKQDAKELLEKLREKNSMTSKQREIVIDHITENIDKHLERGFQTLDDAMESLSNKMENLSNFDWDSKIANSFKNSYSTFKTNSEKLAKEMVQKQQQQSSQPKREISSLEKALNEVRVFFYRAYVEFPEIDGIKYVDVTFNPSVDPENDLLDIFGNDVKIVEWEEIPKERFGVQSKMFGVDKQVKVLRITEEELVKQYEDRMGRKVS